jgi:organic radical activating enzyme
LGGSYDAAALADTALSIWPCNTCSEHPFIICTGGEPMMQLDERFVAEMHTRGCEIAIETNGSVSVPPSIDWIACSPKPGAALRQLSGN